MNPFVYFIKTPSRYRRDAGLMAGVLLTLALSPLIFLFQGQAPQAVGAEGAVAPVMAQSSPVPVTQAAAQSPSPARIWPARGAVTAEFGGAGHPFTGRHTGLDIAGPANQPVLAFAGGTVTQVGALTAGCGKCVFVDHGNGLESHYSHLSSIAVVPGQHVEPGTPVGTQGNTGWSTGPHVHFAIQVNGVAVNPRGYVAGNPAR